MHKKGSVSTYEFQLETGPSVKKYESSETYHADRICKAGGIRPKRPAFPDSYECKRRGQSERHQIQR